MPDDNSGFRNPIVILALLLVISLIALIASAVFGVDRGVLTNMADREYARGLITFLFAVVTIGTALFLVVSGLISRGDDLSEKQFQHGKEVFSLLLGVFGTIVGYYFGSTFTSPHAPSLRLSSLQVLPSAARPGETVTAKALIAGGTAPYRYSIFVGDEKDAKKVSISDNGSISDEIALPVSARGNEVTIRLKIVDERGQEAEVSGSVPIRHP